tara:strand:+ start:1671 stop:1877 length:207 start_codon:yes stop_codon:yes gene_type:complete
VQIAFSWVSPKSDRPSIQFKLRCPKRTLLVNINQLPTPKRPHAWLSGWRKSPQKGLMKHGNIAALAKD